MDIGSKVKRLRQANGLTLEELANRSEFLKKMIFLKIFKMNIKFLILFLMLKKMRWNQY